MTYTIDGTAATSFNPATLGAGTHTVVATGTLATTSCQNTATQTVTVNPLPVVAFTGLNPAYCAGDAALTLAATLDASTTNGPVTFTINNNPATSFDPTTLAPGTYTVVATGTLTSTGCVGTTSQTVVINALPTVAFAGLNPAYCVSAPAVTLAATVSGGGTTTFTINGTAATTFDPAALGVGTYTVVATGVQTSTTCQNTVSQTVVVNQLPTVAITGLSGAYCVAAPAVTLTGTVNGVAGTVTFTIERHRGDGVRPGHARRRHPHGGADRHRRQRLPEYHHANGRHQRPADGGDYGPEPRLLPGRRPGEPGRYRDAGGAIAFTVNGNPDGRLRPDDARARHLHHRGDRHRPNQCIGTATQTVTLNERPAVAITGLSAGYCVSAAATPLTGTVAPTGTTAFTIDGNAATSFDPATLGVGIHTVVLTGTVTATGCQNAVSLAVAVNPLPNIAITGLNPAYCPGDAPVTLAGTLNGTAAPLNFTLNGTAATVFDPTALAPGTYTLVATGTDANACQNTTTQTVTLNARPAALTPSGPPSVCPGLLGVPYAIAGAANQSFQWSVVGGTIATGQGTASVTVDWGPANPGAGLTVTTIDGTTGCASVPATYTVRVNQILATQTPVGTSSFCVNGGSQTFSIPIPSPGSTYNWTLGGTAVGTLTGNGSPTVVVTFTQPGTATLLVEESSTTGLGMCFGTSAPLNVTVLAAPDPTLTIQASAPATCANAPVTFTLNGAAGSTYVWTVDGVAQTGATAGTFTYPAATAGTFSIGAQETNAGGCVGPVFTTPLTVNVVPGRPSP